MIIHATSVVFCGHGVLIRGCSGSGKSDLALRLIDAGGVLIADDRTIVEAEDGALYGSSPEAIAGLMEIRGVGLRKMPHIQRARLDVCFNCVERMKIARMPESETVEIAGISLPLYGICAFDASVVAKIRSILQYPAAS